MDASYSDGEVRAPDPPTGSSRDACDTGTSSIGDERATEQPLAAISNVDDGADTNPGPVREMERALALISSCNVATCGPGTRPRSTNSQPQRTLALTDVETPNPGKSGTPEQPLSNISNFDDGPTKLGPDCLLCGRNDPQAKLYPISEEKLKRLKYIAIARAKGKYQTWAARVLGKYYETGLAYHGYCNKKFTAISEALLEHAHILESEKKTLQGGGDEEKVKKKRGPRHIHDCVYCEKGILRKRNNYRETTVLCPEGTARHQQIKENCEDLGCTYLLASTITETSGYYYHRSCHNVYKGRARRLKKRKRDKRKTEMATTRDAHTYAFCQLKEYINANIIKAGGVDSLQNLNLIYTEIVKQENGNADSYYPNQLLRKLNEHFGNKLLYEDTPKHGKIVYSKSIPISDGAKAIFLDNLDTGETPLLIEKVAYAIRNEINSYEQDEMDGLPPLLSIFLNAISNGPKFGQREDLSPRFKSIGSDLLFAISNGKIVPLKNRLLGQAVKAMTGSKTILRILNKLGHSINYWKVEELETANADKILAAGSATPDGLITGCPELTTFMAYDNYDEFVETLSGKETLHDTMGICIQDRPESASLIGNGDPGKTSTRTTKKRRFQGYSNELEPYRKKLRLCEPNIEICLEKEELPPLYLDGKVRDVFFAFTHFLSDNVPMWIGYNALTVIDEQPTSVIGYMPNFTHAATDPAMVLKSLQVTRQVANECKQTYGVVHYDLGMAKPAFVIQSMEKMNDLFILPGALHIFFAYFGAIGKIIEGSGFEHILVETGALAANSVKGVLTGKSYNRARRLHAIFALALQQQHIAAFVRQDEIEVPDGLPDFLGSLLNEPYNLSSISCPEEFKHFFKLYEQFCEETMAGKRGVTAQFWFSYIKMVQLYLCTSRAVRLNDIDLFTYCLHRMNAIFFFCNNQNYARYLTLVVSNLQKIEQTHPGLKANLRIGVKRTVNPFSAAPVDQTLECTVNRDAASRLTGISAMTNDVSCRQKWAVGKSQNARAVSDLKEIAGLTDKDDLCNELKTSRKNKDKRTLEEIVKCLSENVDPFAEEYRECQTLFNIGSGQAATEHVRDSLLNVFRQGETLRDEFAEKSQMDENHFNKPLKRRKVESFATMTPSVVKAAPKKIEKNTSALLGRLCYLVSKGATDLEDALSSCLTDVPLSLADASGALTKTRKGALADTLLDKYPKSIMDSENVDADIIDALVLIRKSGAIRFQTFGDWSMYLMKEVLKTTASEIHIVFDTYSSPSLKDMERERRGAGCPMSDLEFRILGPSQKAPANIQNALNNIKFKIAFCNYLAEQWKRQNIRCEKKIYITQGEHCFLLHEEKCVEIHDLRSNHEEADTRILFHALWVATAGNKTIRIRSNDTDVLVIFLSNINPNDRNRFIVEYGTGANKKSVDVTFLAKEMGEQLSKAMAGYHAFSGSDFTSAFHGKGKVLPLKQVMANPEWADLFGRLGLNQHLTTEELQKLEKFTCKIYRSKKTKVNEARVEIFSNKMKPMAGKPAFHGLKAFNPSSLPPCKTSLDLHSQRANHIAYIWRHANCGNFTINPVGHGWRLEDGILRPIWDSKPPLHLQSTSSLEEEDPASSDEESYEEISSTSSEESDSEN